MRTPVNVRRHVLSVFASPALFGFYVFFAGFFFVHTAHAVVYIPNVTALYHFDDSEDDSSGNGRDLTGSGTAYVNGKLSKAGDNQTTGYWTATTAAMDISGDFTIGFWLNPQAGINDTPFIDRVTSSGGNREGMYYGNTCVANTIEFKHNNSCHTSSYTFSTSTWYWIVLARTGSNVDYYVNNSSTFSFTDSEAGNIDRTLCIGGALGLAGGGCNTYSHKYYMDELFFMNSRISTSTKDAIYNSGNGNMICATVGCDSTSTPTISSSTQYKSDGTTPLGEGSTTAESTVFFKAYLNSSSSNNLQLQVQISTSTSFTGVLNGTSTSVTPGNYATTTIPSIPDGWYYWRAKVVDTATNASSSWQQYGTANVVDFIVKTVPNSQVEISNGSITGLYHFEDGSDTSGNLHHLTPSGSKYVQGKLSGAGDTEGAGYWRASSSAMDISGDFTVGFWIRAQVGLNDTPFIDKIDSGGSSREGFYYGNTCAANQIEFKHNNACHNSAYTISTDTWYWFLVARTGSNVDYYVNNSKVFSFSDSETGNISRDICIGALGLAGGGCSSYNHAYYLDELFFDNTRLPTSTLDALWHGGLGAEVCTTQGCSGENILSGTIGSSTTWTHDLSPYIVTSTVTISSSVKVTVEPGVVIKFKDSTALIVNGELDIKGTSSTLTYFTSYHDDSVGGDMNGDGSTTNATSGDWGHIKINSGASTTLSGAVVRYGGGDASSSANVWNNGGTLNVSSSDVSLSGYYGFRINGGATAIRDSIIRDNEVAIYFDSGNATVASSSIFDNATYGVSQGSSPTSTMENNFWGGWSPVDHQPTSTTFNPGPYNNPGNIWGIGDPVTSYVDFSPYTSAYFYDWTTNWSSVDDREIRWGGSTASSSAWSNAVNAWNNVTPLRVTLVDANADSSSTWDMYIEDVNDSSLGYYGEWTSYVTSTQKARIRLNYASDALGSKDADGKKIVMMHELGHALGLDHSPDDNNVMKKSHFFTPAVLGSQDLHDYEFRWGQWWSDFWE